MLSWHQLESLPTSHFWNDSYCWKNRLLLAVQGRPKLRRVEMRGFHHRTCQEIMPLYHSKMIDFFFKTAQRPRPRKPQLKPTTNTPIEIIDIGGNISKCAGCHGSLKDGPPDAVKQPLDEKVCVRHKENDYFFHQQRWEYLPKLENKHYHISKDCVGRRNPQFDVNDTVVSLRKQQPNKVFNFFFFRFFLIISCK